MSKDLIRAGELLPEILKPEHRPLTPIQERLLALPLPASGEETAILYQHSVLCQTCLPYRDPGAAVRSWQRHNGHVHLLLQAGQALDPKTETFVEIGMPFGAKPRLVLFHLNAEAVRTQSPLVELADSLTAFVSRTLGLDPGGRNIRVVKEQLTRLAASDFKIGASFAGRAITVKGAIIEGFELWTPRDPHQKMLWPTTIQFSRRYFESLVEHAVPLNETAIARLAHNAMALDIYTWLAQRLHRVDPAKPAAIPWASLRAQFGGGYTHLWDFRRVFLRTLKQVHVVYREARFSVDENGMRLSHSPPPVLRRLG